MALTRANALLITTLAAFTYLPIQANVAASATEYRCYVETQDAKGEWWARRSLTENGGLAGTRSDSYKWEPQESLQVEPGITLHWDMRYDWPNEVREQKEIPESEIFVFLWFRIEPLHDQTLNNPNRSWLHLYRATNPDKKQTFDATSLTQVMFWHQSKDGILSTKAVIPLDHLLAFGTEFDAIVWNIRSEPNEFGGTYAFAKGVLPIADLRNTTSQIQKLRRELDKKAKSFRKECQSGPVPVVPNGY